MWLLILPWEASLDLQYYSVRFYMRLRRLEGNRWLRYRLFSPNASWSSLAIHLNSHHERFHLYWHYWIGALLLSVSSVTDIPNILHPCILPPDFAEVDLRARRKHGGEELEAGEAQGEHRDLRLGAQRRGPAQDQSDAAAQSGQSDGNALPRRRLQRGYGRGRCPRNITGISVCKQHEHEETHREFLETIHSTSISR